MRLKFYHKTPCFYPDGSVNFYTAQLTSTFDYYPFGQGINARSYSIGGQKYRYNHNGHEVEDDIADGAVSAEFWMYDGRLGRRWETDPIIKPWESLYACFRNNPIYYADPSGLDGDPSVSGGDKGKGKGGNDADKGNNKDIKFKKSDTAKPKQEKKTGGATDKMEPIKPLMPQDNTRVEPQLRGTNESNPPESGSTVNLSDNRRNTNLFKTLNVPSNNPMFSYLKPMYSYERRWMAIINWEQGNTEVSWGGVSFSNNAYNQSTTSITLFDLIKIGNDGNKSFSQGPFSAGKNSFDIWAASSEMKKVYIHEPLQTVPTSTMVYEISYTNSTRAWVFGNRHIVVKGGIQVFESVPVTQFNILFLDTNTNFWRFPGSIKGVGVDAKSN